MSHHGSNEFDDPELIRSLGRVSGASPDENAAYAQVRARVRQVRRRRAAAWSSGALVAVVAVGAFALSTQRGGRTLEPADLPEVVDDSFDDLSDDSTSSSLPAPVTTVATTDTATSLPETTSTDLGLGDDEPANTEGDGTEVSTPPSGGVPTTAKRTEPKPPKAPTSTNPSTQAPVTSGQSSSTSEPDGDDDDDDGGSVTPQTQTFSGVGGAITVSIDSEGRLKMLSYTANSGYTAEDIRNGDQRVGIRFRIGEVSTRIRVEVSGGVMVPNIEEEG
jgi:hypothetical protein